MGVIWIGGGNHMYSTQRTSDLPQLTDKHHHIKLYTLPYTGFKQSNFCGDQ